MNQVSEAARIALEKYCAFGEMIREGTDFPDSALYQLEQSMINPEMFADEYPLGSDMAVQMNRSFVALVAPSLEGKTQSAFVLSLILPLYFIANAVILTNSDEIVQEVYQNFTYLSKVLLSLAKKDVEVLQNQQVLLPPKINESDIPLVKISGSSIENYFKCNNSATLGFLKALIENSDSGYISTENWMNFHAKRGTISSSPVSITYFNNTRACKNSKKYCVFLDEFDSSLEVVFVRNLCRILGIKCIVANTNASISNLTGKRHSTYSRSSMEKVWSIVFPRLNYVSPTLVKSAYNLDLLVARIKEKCLNSDPQLTEKFLTTLIKGLIFKMRPGLALVLLDYFSQLSLSTNTFTVSTLLSLIVNQLQEALTRRKQSMASFSSKLANIALLTHVAYLNGESSSDYNMYISHLKSFLKDHLFYVVNPVDPDKCWFLTYAPIPSTEEETTQSEYLRVRLSAANFPDWKHELTYFNSDEVLTIISCMKMPLDGPILEILKKSLSILKVDPNSIADYNNPTTQSLNGNHLEVLSSTCIINSTHYSGFCGPNGIDFLKLLVYNLYPKDFKFDANGFDDNVPDDETSFNLKRFLLGIRIPFLYANNCQVPEFLGMIDNHERLPFGENSILFGEYRRTSNSSQIDSNFNFYSESSGEAASAIVECKNWGRQIPATELISILSKALRSPNSKLSLIFCKKASGIQQENESSLQKAPVIQHENESLLQYCRSERLSLYRLKGGENQFNFTRFHSEPDLYPLTPRLVVLVFELNVFNGETY